MSAHVRYTQNAVTAGDPVNEATTLPGGLFHNDYSFRNATEGSTRTARVLARNEIVENRRSDRTESAPAIFQGRMMGRASLASKMQSATMPRTDPAMEP